MKRFFHLICLAGIALSGWHCSNLTIAGGSSSTDNGMIAGTIRLPTGAAAPRTQVFLCPADYDPVKDIAAIPADTTDSSGRYAFSAISPGSYNVYSVNPCDRTSGLVKFIHVEEDTVIASVDTLQKPGAITVTLPSGLDTNAGYFYVSGTPFHVLISPNKGSVTLDSVSANVALSVYYSVKGSGEPPQLVRDSIVVEPGGIVTIAYLGWNYSQKLVLNTTASGAGIAGAVTGFPVLIRLTGANFSFAEAGAGGADVRFAKSDGTPLSYEIERWDASSQAAEIWVKVDTVLGNNSSQFIMMYWGNSNAASESNGAAVFDTTNGFQGVWHLGDNAANSSVREATGRNNGVMKSGTSEINTSVANSSGMVGDAKKFNGFGAKYWIDLGANRAYLNGTQEITVSLWMNATVDTFASKQMFCISKSGVLSGSGPESRASLGVSLNKIVLTARSADSDPGQVVTSATTFQPNLWYHCVGVIKIPEDSMYLYINGQLSISGKMGFGLSATDATNSTNSSIGADDNGTASFFNGSIDEARLEVFARSADWIKLSYENQKANDAVVVFK